MCKLTCRERRQPGNKTNLRIAQLKGGARTKALGEITLDEFVVAYARAKEAGAETAREIATEFNETGYKTSSGVPWTIENVAGYIRKVKTAAARKKALLKLPPPAPPSIADADRKPTPDGLARYNRAMTFSGFKLGTTGKLMAHLGFSRNDTACTHALHCGRGSLSEVHCRAIDEWVAGVEATYPPTTV